jgi:hypothetical protein
MAYPTSDPGFMMRALHSSAPASGATASTMLMGSSAGGELPLPARNAQFATSVERFLGLEPVRSHRFAASILSL